MSSPTGLLSIQDKLLTRLFVFLEHPDLFSLSATNKRLHHLALPLYLASFGVSDPFTHLDLPTDRVGVVRGLCSALFISRITSLRCAFNARAALDGGEKSLRALSHLVGTLKSVEEVEIDLWRFEEWGISRIHGADWHPSKVEKLSVIAEADPCATAPDDEWARELRSILNLAVTQKQCKVLKVSRGQWVSEYAPPAPKRMTPVRALNRGRAQSTSSIRDKIVPRAFKRLGSFGSQMVARETVVPDPSQHHLETLHIHSPVLFHPLLYTWTLDILNTAPITTLSLTSVALACETWSYILAAVTLPRLTTLTLARATFDFKALVRFLDRHPTITTLDIAAATIVIPENWLLPSTLLPHLVTLRARPDSAAALLRDAAAFPALAALEIVSFLVPGAPATGTTPARPAPSTVRLDRALAALARRTASFVHLTLTLHGQPATRAWILASVPAALAAGPGASRASLSSTLSGLSANPALAPPVGCVTALTVVAAGGGHVLSRIPPWWLARFPRLREAAFPGAGHWFATGRAGARARAQWAAETRDGCREFMRVSFGNVVCEA